MYDNWKQATLAFIISIPLAIIVVGGTFILMAWMMGAN